MRLNLLSSLAELCRSTAYNESTRYGTAEPVSTMHRDFTRLAWDEVILPNVTRERGEEVLDVGAGDGYSLELALIEGWGVFAVNLLAEDMAACHRKGIPCAKRDMHDLPEWWVNRFKLVFARHVFEHSPFPMLALGEAHRVMKPGGYLYMETPAPGTACCHETNPSHFSVHTQSMWTQLLLRTGFEMIQMTEIHFNTVAGDDIYYRWLCRKHVEG